MPISPKKPPTQRLPKTGIPPGKPLGNPPASPPSTPPSGTPSRPNRNPIRGFLSGLADALGLHDDDGPWGTVKDVGKGCLDGIKSGFDGALHWGATLADATGRSLRKAASILGLKFMGDALGRRVALAIFKIGNRMVGGALIAGFMDILPAFLKNRIGTPLFYGKLAWGLMGIAGTIGVGAWFELWIGGWAFGLCAAAGVSAFVPLIAVPLIAGIIGGLVVKGLGSLLYNFCEQHPNSLLMQVMNAVSSAVTSFFSWLGGLFKPSSASSSGSASSGKYGKSVHIKKSRFWRPGRILPPPWGYYPPPPPPPPPAGFPPPWWPPPPPPIPAGNSGLGGGPPSPGTAAAPVGGVLFQNCHAVLTGIEELSGGYWDERTHALVLVGKGAENGHQRTFSLPPMDTDHLIVALRAALVGEPLGVSIDPPAGYRYGKGGQQMPPDRSPLIVSYLGHSEGTLAGAIFFEADRIMKCLSVGVDNQKRKPFNSNVPGFQSTFDMHSNGDKSRNNSWHRFWFVVEHVEMKKSSNGSAFTFGDVKIAVKTELQMPGAPAGQTIDPVDMRFAEHLTRNYSEFAKEFPVFARLKELAKISAIASFVVNQNVSLDWGNILETEPMEVDTPETTPSILRSVTSQNGNVLYTHMMSGGVNLGVTPRIEPETAGEVSRFQRAASADRPSAASEWAFSEANTKFRAKAFNIGQKCAFRSIEIDHQFAVANGIPTLALKRVYRSSSVINGKFGSGWDLLVPWALTVMRGSGKKPEVLEPKDRSKQTVHPSVLFLRDGTTGATQTYRKISEGNGSLEPSWALVDSQTISKERVSFNYNPGQIIQGQSNRFVLRRDGYVCLFDDTGHLIEMSNSTSRATRYIWNNGLLVVIENNTGQKYSLTYANGTDMINSIEASDGQKLEYVYDSKGCLVEVRIDSSVRAAYAYDCSKRLIEVSDSGGKAVRQATYSTQDEYIQGTLLEKIRSSSGAELECQFSNGRFDWVKDALDTHATATYGPKGNLWEVFVKTSAGNCWKFQYGTNRRLRKVIGPLGHATSFESALEGGTTRITHVILPGRRGITVPRTTKSPELNTKDSNGKHSATLNCFPTKTPISSRHCSLINDSVNGTVSTRFGNRLIIKSPAGTLKDISTDANSSALIACIEFS